MKVGFITGFSNWGNNSLSPIQFEFMKNINIKESNKIYSPDIVPAGRNRFNDCLPYRGNPCF